jgi:hypothetical protein
MEDLTPTQLFAKMDVLLAQQDAYLAAITETLARQNAEMREAAAMLAATRREVEARGAEASRLHAATVRAFEALIARLEGGR